MATSITYNQYNPESVTFGHELSDFIKAFGEYQDIVVHFENDPVIVARNKSDLYVKLQNYSTGNWTPDAITHIEVRRPETSDSIRTIAKPWW